MEEPRRRGEQANILLWGGDLEEYQGCTLAKVYLSRYQCTGVITPKTQTYQQFISMRPEELRLRARIRYSLSIYALDSWRKSETVLERQDSYFSFQLLGLSQLFSGISPSFSIHITFCSFFQKQLRCHPSSGPFTWLE